MGLELKNPLVVGACPLSDYTDITRRFEDAGAAAIVMHSLFMEQMALEQMQADELGAHADSHAEASSYFPDPVQFLVGPDEYLEKVAELKKAVSILVMGSLR